MDQFYPSFYFGGVTVDKMSDSTVKSGEIKLFVYSSTYTQPNFILGLIPVLPPEQLIKLQNPKGKLEQQITQTSSEPTLPRIKSITPYKLTRVIVPTNNSRTTCFEP